MDWKGEWWDFSWAHRAHFLHQHLGFSKQDLSKAGLPVRQCPWCWSWAAPALCSLSLPPHQAWQGCSSWVEGVGVLWEQGFLSDSQRIFQFPIHARTAGGLCRGRVVHNAEKKGKWSCTGWKLLWGGTSILQMIFLPYQHKFSCSCRKPLESSLSVQRLWSLVSFSSILTLGTGKNYIYSLGFFIYNASTIKSYFY